MKFALNLPINGVSFGQTSVLLLKEIYKRGLTPYLFPVGNAVDLSCYDNDDGFNQWLNECLTKAHTEHSRDVPVFKLWHLFDSLSSVSKTQFLLTFYELDSPTPLELNYAKNNDKVLFSSLYTRDIFDSFGAKNTGYLPLGFDANSFYKKDKVFFNNRITFNICGKFEKRKHHAKAIREWANVFGGKSEYSLQCSIYNPFFSEEQNNQIEAQILNGQKIPNITFLKFMQKNSVYNDYLNSADIVIGCSGGEGWGLPEFQSCALGKHAVILNCGGYKSWATDNNSVLINPNAKIDATDNIFFKKELPYNKGNIFDFSPENYRAALHEAVRRYSCNKLNQAGLELQKDFSAEKFCDNVLSLF